eukprot:6465103-Amphidinium_carterae.1
MAEVAEPLRRVGFDMHDILPSLANFCQAQPVLPARPSGIVTSFPTLQAVAPTFNYLGYSKVTLRQRNWIFCHATELENASHVNVAQACFPKVQNNTKDKFTKQCEGCGGGSDSSRGSMATTSGLSNRRCSNSYTSPHAASSKCPQVPITCPDTHPHKRRLDLDFARLRHHPCGVGANALAIRLMRFFLWSSNKYELGSSHLILALSSDATKHKLASLSTSKAHSTAQTPATPAVYTKKDLEKAIKPTSAQGSEGLANRFQLHLLTIVLVSNYDGSGYGHIQTALHLTSVKLDATDEEAIIEDKRWAISPAAVLVGPQARTVWPNDAAASRNVAMVVVFPVPGGP